MARYKNPESFSPKNLEGVVLRDHYQVTLRKIRRWFLISELDSPEAHSFWAELRNVERPLYRQGISCDVDALESVIAQAHALGFPEIRR